MSDVTAPAAGWYADPEDPSGERWWNGIGWSDQRRGSTVDAVPAAAAPVVPPPTAPQGFTFGSTAPGARPDPYAPAPAVGAPVGYAPSPYVAAPYGAPAYGSGSNGLAIGGLVTSLAGLLFGFLAAVAGIILSAFGLSQAKQREAAGNPNSGRGMAMAGLIIGIAVLVLQIIFVVAYFAFFLSLAPTTLT